MPTVDTIRYEFVISHLLRAGYRPLLVGPVGTGKTSTASTALEAMDSQKTSMLVINMSAQVGFFKNNLANNEIHECQNYYIFVLDHFKKCSRHDRKPFGEKN